MKLIENLSQNMLFNMVILSIVLIGIIATRFFNSKNRKYNLPKILFILLSLFYLVFFNLDIVLDLFGLPKNPTYIMMGFAMIANMVILIFSFFKFKEFFSRLNLTLVFVTTLIMSAAFALEQIIGLDIALIETIVILIMYCSFYNLVVSAFIKMERKK